MMVYVAPGTCITAVLAIIVLAELGEASSLIKGASVLLQQHNTGSQP